MIFLAFFLGLSAGPAYAATTGYPPGFCLGLIHPLPSVKAQDHLFEGFACVKSSLCYWGKPVLSDRKLALDIVKRARSFLGDQRFIELANQNLAFLINNPIAMAWVAGDRGLHVRVEQDANLDQLLTYVGWGETVTVMWTENGTQHYSIVQAIREERIQLMDPGLGGFRDMAIADFLRLWNDESSIRGLVIRMRGINP